jgi:hypothetical protein
LEGLIPANELLHFAGLRESGAPLALWERQEATPSRNLAAARREISFPLKNDLPSVQEITRRLASHDLPAYERERLKRLEGMRSMFGNGGASGESIHAWQLGDALLLASPFEAYSALQIQLRAEFSSRPVVVLNIANGYRGYLPPADHYTRDQYSVDRSPFAAGGLERLISESAELLATLSPEPNKKQITHE